MAIAPQDQKEGAPRFAARPRLGRLAGDTWEPYITLKDHFALRLTARRRPARTTHRLVRYATRFRPTRKAKLLVRSLRKRLDRYRSRGFKVPVYNTWLTRLPVRRGSVVLESHMGTCYGDSPRALYQEIRRQGLKLHATWSYDPSPAGFPDDARLVRRWSWRYLWALARAEYWVDNQGFPQQLHKPRHTTYLQTWHGSAYKRMGFDETRVRLQNAPGRERLQRAVDRFDHFLVRSEHDVNTLARAYRLPEERLLRTGYPRNDALIAERTRSETEGRLPRPPLAGALGLDDHKKTVLYAPTFRGGPGKQRRARLLLDVREFAERFGDTHTLLVRAHYLESARLPLCPPGTVVDVSRHHDVSELLALTDVLITDYSSIMFDFALLDRPVVLYAPDLEAYAAERGSYFDLREEAPGPVTATQEELFAALAELKKSDTRYADRRRAFVRRFGPYDRGDAARRIVAAVFAPGSSRDARHTIDHDRGPADEPRHLHRLQQHRRTRRRHRLDAPDRPPLRRPGTPDPRHRHPRVRPQDGAARPARPPRHRPLPSPPPDPWTPHGVRDRFRLPTRRKETARGAAKKRAVARLSEIFATARPGAVVIVTQVWAMEWVGEADTTGLRVIGMSHESYGYSRASHRYRWIKNHYKDLDHWLVLTEEDADQWAGDGMNNVGFLPNALSRLPAVPSPRTARTVASIGRLSDQKGIDLLLDSWALVAPARPDWRLRVYGTGEDEAALKARCTGLGLDGSVEWMGRTDDVERALAEASVFVQSSRGEGFPLALLEAMASGVPCAAFDCAPGVREIVRDGEDGLLAPAGDVAALADRLLRLTGNPRLRDAMGARARSGVQRFSEPETLRRWEELFAFLER